LKVGEKVRLILNLLTREWIEAEISRVNPKSYQVTYEPTPLFPQGNKYKTVPKEYVEAL
jgi:hypothetical protein